MAYTELNTDQNLIRLLHLGPATSPEDAIRCVFSVVSLDDELQHEGLSYVWGEMSDNQEIEIGESRFSVTANLFCASRHLRFQERTRVLWVDAL